MKKNMTNKLLSILLCVTMVFVNVVSPRAIFAEDDAAVIEEPYTEEIDEAIDDQEEFQEIALEEDEAIDNNDIEPEEETTETEEIADSGISVNKDNDLYEVMLFGNNNNIDEASLALSEEEDSLTEPEAKLMMAPLFKALRNGNDDEDVEEDYPFPRRLDGSDIEHISIRWITRDTEENNKPEHLYLVPEGDSPFSVRFQIDYALSGEHHYEPGDITIRIPAQIFHKRNNNETKDIDEGQYIGGMIIPLAQSPLTTTDFNWALVDGEYVLTNTKSVIAATKGFIQFEINNLIPHSIVDMSLTDNLQATIEVVTHLENTIGLKSNKIFAQINTTHEVVRANKLSGTPEIIEASEVSNVPDWIKEKYPNEEHYLLVPWSTNSYHTGNQPFVLTGYDTRTDVATGETSETLHDGFVVDGDTDNTKDLGVVFIGWEGAGTSKYSKIDVIYPLSQFERDTEYTFTNHVDYELTPIDEVDQKTTASADGVVVWSYTEPVWVEPIGHFNTFKWGNDNDPGKRSDNEWTTHNKSSVIGDIPTAPSYVSQHLNGYYGLYQKALNELRDKEEVNIAYTIKSEGYLLPWTYEGDTRQESSYGKRPVTMITEDMKLWRGTQTNYEKEFVVGEDFDFVSLDFIKPDIGKIKAINVNPDGSFIAKYAEDGTFEYQPDDDVTKIPPVVLEVLINNEWIEYASADWTSGDCVITLNDGTTISGTTVDFPANTQTFRTKVTSGNAYIYYYVRPEIVVYPTSEMVEFVNSLFENNPSPETQIWNEIEMVAYDYDGNEIVTIDKNGYDRLNGYSADTAVIPYKSGRITDINYDQKKVHLHYEAKVEERSLIGDLETYQNVVADGLIKEETGGIWWDLLPLGVVPDRDSVRLRSGDRIKDVYTIPDYKGTGRIMLVVEAELTPNLVTYTGEGGLQYIEDVPSISFDATCDISYIIEYGQITEPDELFSADLHNVIAFESNNDSLGTIEGYKGENNDPRGNNNVRTPEACIDEEELDAMTGLHNNRNSNSFLYAGCNNHVAILNAASTSLLKEVSVNNDHWWSQGTYYGNREANARDVFEGGMYSYRVFMMSNANTQTRDMILYDSLENYVAIQGNDEEDIEAQAAGKI